MAFTYYSPFVIDHTKVVGSVQTDFPAIIKKTDSRLRHTSYGGHVTSLSGFDIVPFTATDLLTAIAFKLISYNPISGTVYMRVKIASLSNAADTTIYLGYGNSSISTDQSSTSAFDSSFKLATVFRSTWVDPYRVAGNTPIIDRALSANFGMQVYDPCVFNHSNGTHVVMLFSGMDGSTPAHGEQRIFRATALRSADLTLAASWTVNTTAVLSKGTAGQWDEGAAGLRSDCVPIDASGNPILIGGAVPLYYSGTKVDNAQSVGLATTLDDGVTWTKQGRILDAANANSGTETDNTQSRIVYDGGVFKCLYAYRTAGATLPGYRYAESPNGTAASFVKDGLGDVISNGPLGSDDAFGFEWGQLINKGVVDATYYYMPYEASMGAIGNDYKYGIHLARATSVKGPWTKAPMSPIASGSGVSGSFDEKMVATGAFYFYNSQWLLFLCGAATTDQTASTWSLAVRQCGNLTPADAFNAASIADATSNGNDWTGTSVFTPNSAGPNGAGFSGDNVSRRLQKAGLVIPVSGTFSCWWMPKGPIPTTATSYAATVVQGILEVQAAGPKLFVAEFDDNGNLYFGWYNNAAGTPDKRAVYSNNVVSPAIVARTRYFIAGHWTNGGTVTLRVNKTTLATASTLGSTWDTSGATTSVCERVRVPDYGDGQVSDIMISDTNRSLDWTDTEYNNSSAPDAFGAFGTEQPTAPPTAPDLTYATPQSWVKGTAISTLTPSNAGGTPTSCVVSTGALPAGLTLNSDGTVTGTPTTVGSGSFKVTPTNATGTGPESPACAWSVAINAPSLGSYSGGGAKNIRDTISATVANTGGAGTFAELSGDSLASLGLTLNPATGTVTGALIVTGSKSTVIRCTNVTGHSDATLAFTISNILPVITYASTLLYNVVNNSLPTTSAGGTIPATGAYSKVSGTYPTGISNINADTGALAGTPTVLGETGTLVLRATNAIGNGDFTLNWTVVAADGGSGSSLATSAVPSSAAAASSMPSSSWGD